ncbi:MAG: DUF1003 domain-containing protein [Actinobacteria bacterium]|nr:DUF1003 domain-containing protein [Actinomycetota bacterium]
MSVFRRGGNGDDFDAPQEASTSRRKFRFGWSRESSDSNEVFGRWSEGIARGMGTPWFLLALSIFCAIWLVWNTLAPEQWRFDSAALGFTALTLILSLQASYAAPLILLAQNRQDDRDRVQIEQDRQGAERNLADTEFLAREVVALRLALKDLPDRDFLRAELRSLLAELEAEKETPAEAPEAGPGQNDAAHRAAE